MKKAMQLGVAVALALSATVASSAVTSSEEASDLEWKRSLLPEQRGVLAASTVQISNEYVDVIVDGTGRFTMQTTGGDPNNPRDDHAPLLYEKVPYSSYTTIRLNGASYAYGAEGGAFVSTPKLENGVVSSVYRMAGMVDVKQNLRLVNGTSLDGKRQDVLEMEYTLTNQTDRQIDAGVRVLLDTMLGANDAAPFRIPGFGSLNKEREFTGAEVPNYWQAFDSLVEPSVVAQGTFSRGIGPKPDRVQFGSWRGLFETKWDYAVSPDYLIDDSAVAATWNMPLEAHETKTVRTYYGLSGFQQDMRPPLGIAVAAEPEVTQVEGGYNPNPIGLQAFITNLSETTASNAALTVELPDGLYLIDQGGEKQSVVLPLGTLAAGEEISRSFFVHIKPQTTAREFVYNVRLAADLTGTKTMEMRLRVPELQSAVASYPAIEKLFGPAFQEKLKTLPQ